jgi:hypothetical protein
MVIDTNAATELVNKYFKSWNQPRIKMN